MSTRVRSCWRALPGLFEAARDEDIPLKLSLEAVLATETPVSEEDIGRLMAELPPQTRGLVHGMPRTSRCFLPSNNYRKRWGPFTSPLILAATLSLPLRPFNLGNTIMGYGLSLASSSGMRHALPHKAISIMGDGGFWHNGLTSGVPVAVFNKHDGLLDRCRQRLLGGNRWAGHSVVG